MTSARKKLLLTASGIGVALLTAPLIAQSPRPTSGVTFSKSVPQRWTYARELTCKYPDDVERFIDKQAKILRDAGEKSFELVSLFEFNGPKPDRATYCILAVFKRPEP